MKHILFLIIIALTFQNASFAQVGDAKAKAVLGKVSESLKNMKSMKANFEIAIKSKNGKVTDTRKGSVYMKGDKYHVKINGQEIYSDNETVWTYIKESNEVQISEFEDGDESFTPNKLFTNFYEKAYAYKYLGFKKYTKNSYYFVGLMPLKKSVQYEKIVLKINKASNLVMGGSVYDKNGNVYKYKIYNYSKNPSLSDNIFTFNKSSHPNVEVVDLR